MATASRASKSHTSIAATMRGIHQAGSSHSSPSSTTTKKRGPKAKGITPSDSARPLLSAGTSGCSAFIAQKPSWRALLRNFHGQNHLVDDLVRRETFQVGFRL